MKFYFKRRHRPSLFMRGCWCKRKFSYCHDLFLNNIYTSTTYSSHINVGIIVIVVKIKTVTVSKQLSGRYIVRIYYSGLVFGFVDYYYETIKVVWCRYYIIFQCRELYLHLVTFICFIRFIKFISTTNSEFKIFNLKY
jgi:hypothetical protein